MENTDLCAFFNFPWSLLQLSKGVACKEKMASLHQPYVNWGKLHSVTLPLQGPGIERPCDCTPASLSQGCLAVYPFFSLVISLFLLNFVLSFLCSFYYSVFVFLFLSFSHGLFLSRLPSHFLFFLSSTSLALSLSLSISFSLSLSLSCILASQVVYDSCQARHTCKNTTGTCKCQQLFLCY